MSSTRTAHPRPAEFTRAARLNRLSRLFTPLFAMVFALGLALGLPLDSAAAPLPAQTLRYAVDYDGTDAAEMEIDIAVTADRYVVTATSRFKDLAALLLSDYTSETIFTRSANGVELLQGNERLVGKQNVVRGYTVERKQNRIRFNDGKTSPLDQTPLVAAAFPLHLLQAPLTKLEGKRVTQVSTKRVRPYVYQATQPVTLNSPLGKWPTQKVTRVRTDPTSRVSVWLTTAKPALVLQIEVVNKDRTVTLKLTHCRGNPHAACAAN